MQRPSRHERCRCPGGSCSQLAGRCSPWTWHDYAPPSAAERRRHGAAGADELHDGWVGQRLRVGRQHGLRANVEKAAGGWRSLGRDGLVVMKRGSAVHRASNPPTHGEWSSASGRRSLSSIVDLRRRAHGSERGARSERRSVRAAVDPDQVRERLGAHGCELAHAGEKSGRQRTCKGAARHIEVFTFNFRDLDAHGTRPAIARKIRVGAPRALRWPRDGAGSKAHARWQHGISSGRLTSTCSVRSSAAPRRETDAQPLL